MVQLNLKELRRLSAEQELSLNYIAKDLMISKCLLELQDFKNIVFKGGTALNRVYLKKIGKMRFSEDIDLDYNTIKEPKQVINKINNILQNKLNSFNIARPRIMNKTIRFDLSYINPLQHKDKIKIEFRIKKINEKHSKKIVNFGFVAHDSALLNIYEKEVFIKHKINCILSRKEGKDIYDLYYLLEDNTDISKRTAQRLLKSLDLNKAEIKQIANSTNHYLQRNLRPNWEEFINELKKKITSLS